MARLYRRVPHPRDATTGDRSGAFSEHAPWISSSPARPYRGVVTALAAEAPLVIPSRIRHYAEAKTRYGGLTDVLVRALSRTDPVADAVVEAFAELGPARGRAMLQEALSNGIDSVPDAPTELRTLFAQVDTVPSWVDFERCELGARVYRRVSFGGVLTLSAYSLMAGYHSAAAIKPLSFTGGLAKRTPRRLAETGRYVVETSRAGGLRRDGEGLHVAVRVRVMHAQVRRMLRASGRWDEGWGAPINQADMAITAMEFSSMVLRGCRALGYVFDPEESAAVMHLFRYAGDLMGVDEELLTLLDTEAAARRYEDLVRFTIDGPDADSLELAAALRDAFVTGAKTPAEALRAMSLRPLHDGLVWTLCGPRVAADLGMTRPWLRHLVPPVAVAIGALEQVRRRVPALDRVLTEQGGQALDEQITNALAGNEPAFDASAPGKSGPAPWWVRLVDVARGGLAPTP